MSDQWKRVEDHLREASLYEAASPRPAAASWRRRLLSRYGAPGDPLPAGGRLRQFFPAIFSLSLVLLALILAWHYGYLDGFLASHDPASLEVADRRPSEWIRLAMSLLEVELPRFGLKSFFAMLALSAGLTVLVRRRSLNFLPLDW